MTVDMEKAVDAAIRYADRGWPVFPVAPAPQKRPMNDDGFLAATTDHSKIIEWWSRWPTAQVGIACGAAGIVAIDVDVKPDRGIDGRVALDELRMQYGAIDSDLVMLTPSGGTQTFFADPQKRCRRRLGVRNGIDLLGDGGYTIAPSPASPGREWLSGDPLEELAPAPEWLVELAGSDNALTSCHSGKRQNVRTSTADEQGPPLSPAQVADIRAALAYIDNWSRDTWLRMCFALRSTGAGEQAYQLWTEWSKRTPDGSTHPKFNEHDQRKAWTHSRPSFADGSEVTLNSLFHMAQKEGYAGPTADMPQTEIVLQLKPRAAEQAAEPVEEQAGLKPAAEEPKREPVVMREADLESPLPKTATINLSSWDEVAAKPPVEWQVEGLIPVRSMFMVGGDTAAGKSFLLIDLALRIAHGMHWCGRRIRPGNVLYLCGEGHEGVAGRLRAWAKHVRPEGLQAAGYCIFSDRIPELSAKTIKTVHELVQAVAKATGAPPDVVTFDTLSQALVADENDAAEVSAVLRGIDLLRKRWGCSIGFAHHTVKLNAKLRRGEQAAKPTRDSMRGSSAITRNVDTVLGLIVGDGGVTRELHTWKQKDGDPQPPIHLQLLQVETGANRRDGSPETSCILVPDPIAGGALDKTPEEPSQNDEDAFQAARVAAAAPKIAAAEEAVLALLRSSGAVQGPGNRGGLSMGSIKEQVRARAQIVKAAVENLLLKGAAVDVGGSRGKSILARPEDAGRGAGRGDPVPETRDGHN